MRDNLSSKTVKTLCYDDTYNNIFTISINKNSKSFLYTVCYRSPSSDNVSFLPNFKRIITDIGKRESVICGDFNYNLFNVQYHEATENYYNHMQANSYFPVYNTKANQNNGDICYIN